MTKHGLPTYTGGGYARALFASLFLIAGAVGCGNGVDGTGQHSTVDGGASPSPSPSIVNPPPPPQPSPSTACTPKNYVCIKDPELPEPNCDTDAAEVVCQQGHDALVAAGQDDPCFDENMEVAKEFDEGAKIRCEEMADMAKANAKGLKCSTDQNEVNDDEKEVSEAKNPCDYAYAEQKLQCAEGEEMDDCMEAEEAREKGQKDMDEQHCDDDKSAEATCKLSVCDVNQANKVSDPNAPEQDSGICACSAFSNGACNGVDDEESSTAAMECWYAQNPPPGGDSGGSTGGTY